MKKTAREWVDDVGRAECVSMLMDTDMSHTPEMVFVLGSLADRLEGYYMSVYAGYVYIYAKHPKVSFLLSVYSCSLDGEDDADADADMYDNIHEMANSVHWDLRNPDSWVNDQLEEIASLYV